MGMLNFGWLCFIIPYLCIGHRCQVGWMLAQDLRPLDRLKKIHSI
jgi:hypothetical protein